MELQKKTNSNYPWFDNILINILDVYNNKDVHRSIQMTPAEARKPKNEAIVKANLQMRATHNRKYPELKVGDKVKVFRKKTKAQEKERFSIWAPRAWTIKDIKEEKGQDLYFLEDNGEKAPKTYLRFELLKITT